MNKNKEQTMPAAKPRRATPGRRAPARPPKGAILVRTSELTTFKRCRWQWLRSYEECLRSIQEHPALRFGTLIHAALELRYPPGIKRGPHPARSFEKLYDQNLKETEEEWGMFADEEWTDARELGVDMLEGYVEQYGRDEEWQVLQSEMKFAVPVYPDEGVIEPYAHLLSGKINISKPLFWYVGTMDGVWKNRMDGRVRINDYKTTSGDAVKEGEAKSVLDEQATAYWTFGVDYLIAHKLIKPRDQEMLDGMLYTMLAKSKRDDRPTNAEGLALNKDKTVSKVQPKPRFHRELVYRSAADRDAARLRVCQEFLEMEAVRKGNMAAYKSPGLSYPSMQCKACSYRDLCEIDEAGQDWHEARDLTMVKWQPYSAHEIVEEGKGG